MTDAKRPPSDAEVVSSLRHHALGHYDSGVCELAAVRIEALAARLRELEAEVAALVAGTSHDCDIIADMADKHEQDIEAAVKWASAETCSVIGYATPMLGVEAKVLARFKASRKGGSDV